mgnify:CR=1 FL=1
MNKNKIKQKMNFDVCKKNEHPFPYIVIDNFLDEDFLNKLLEEFPQDYEKKTMGGRYVLPNNHELFKNFIDKSKSWNTFNDLIMSNYFSDKVFSLTDEYLKKYNCLINLDNYKNNTWTYYDISASGDGYKREIHHDMDNRIISILIYLNDLEAEGGELVLYESDGDKKVFERQFPTKVKEFKRIVPKRNLAVFKVDTPNSYHSVSEQFNTGDYRKFIYLALTYKGNSAWENFTIGEN